MPEPNGMAKKKIDNIRVRFSPAYKSDIIADETAANAASPTPMPLRSSANNQNIYQNKKKKKQRLNTSIIITKANKYKTKNLALGGTNDPLNVDMDQNITPKIMMLFRLHRSPKYPNTGALRRFVKTNSVSKRPAKLSFILK
jgi:hypothetical protein